ncbi:hypothetical protein AB0J80_36315 [Actinoplanes sp. NPDC049548]|uniref:hypothetical protein n=1 Tax=Actinoplanes sp. NPDC049548 TaxID=3155152 RepID=UPI0034496325
MTGPDRRRIDTGGGWYTEGGTVNYTRSDQRNHYGNTVNTGGGPYVGRDNFRVDTRGGDYVGRDNYRFEDGRPYYHTLRTPGRFCVALGSTALIAGFAMIAYVVYLVIEQVASQAGDGVPAPPDVEWKPWVPLGGALFLAGIFLNAVGSMIGRRR